MFLVGQQLSSMQWFRDPSSFSLWFCQPLNSSPHPYLADSKGERALKEVHVFLKWYRSTVFTLCWWARLITWPHPDTPVGHVAASGSRFPAVTPHCGRGNTKFGGKASHLCPTLCSFLYPHNILRHHVQIESIPGTLTSRPPWTWERSHIRSTFSIGAEWLEANWRNRNLLTVMSNFLK